MKKIWNKILPCILIFTIFLNFTASNIYATGNVDPMSEEGTTSLIQAAVGGVAGAIDGIVGVLTIFLRVIVVGIMGAVQGVLTAIAMADGSQGMIRIPDSG